MSAKVTMIPSATADNPPTVDPTTENSPVYTPVSITPTQTASPAPVETQDIFQVGEEITIDYLRGLEIIGSEITFEEELTSTASYQQHIVSYISEGNRIYGLLTIPSPEPPQDGFKAIVFNHGYVPPADYRTTERYSAYVDYLAWSGFVVFKID